MSLIKSGKGDGNFPAFPSFSGWVDNFFRDDDGFFNAWRNRFAGEMTVPAVNVSQTEKEFSLELAVPGMEKNDFKISIDNGVLTVSAETKSEKEDKGENYTRKEFNFQSFKRSFWLPEGVSADDIKAKYKDGILKISMPKTEVETPETAKMIEVK